MQTAISSIQDILIYLHTRRILYRRHGPLLCVGSPNGTPMIQTLMISFPSLSARVSDALPIYVAFNITNIRKLPLKCIAQPLCHVISRYITMKPLSMTTSTGELLILAIRGMCRQTVSPKDVAIGYNQLKCTIYSSPP